MDTIIEIINSCKYFTDKKRNIGFYIKDLHHGATLSKATRNYTDSDNVMIHTVCRIIEAIRLRRRVKNIDPLSFVIITTTGEIIGIGSAVCNITNM